MPPWKIFENLHTVVAILVLFEQFLGKFFAPKCKCFTHRYRRERLDNASPQKVSRVEKMKQFQATPLCVAGYPNWRKCVSGNS